MGAAAPALSAVLGVLLILVMLDDAFQTIVLPRRVSRPISLGRYFLFLTWLPARAAAPRFKPSRRENFLAYFGPAELIGLLIVWVIGCLVGYGLIYQGLDPGRGFGDYLFFSGSTFTTIGLAALPAAASGWTRSISIAESGTGLAFVALIVAYLPGAQQNFSRREAQLVMLDEWAGSPPSAGELLGRLGSSSEQTVIAFFEQWETWAAAVLESHLSYPVLAYFRSQHDDHSWVAALATILDAASVICAAGAPDVVAWPAYRAFAIARHASVDICQVLGAPPREPRPGHWTDDPDEQALRAAEPWLTVSRTDFEDRMGQQRELYEPYVAALSEHLLMALPPFSPAPGAVPQWQRTAWDVAPGLRLRRRRR